MKILSICNFFSTITKCQDSHSVIICKSIIETNIYIQYKFMQNFTPKSHLCSNFKACNMKQRRFVLVTALHESFAGREWKTPPTGYFPSTHRWPVQCDQSKNHRSEKLLSCLEVTINALNVCYIITVIHLQSNKLNEWCFSPQFSTLRLHGAGDNLG